MPLSNHRNDFMISQIAHFIARTFFPHGAIRRVLSGPMKGSHFVISPGMGVAYWMGRGSENFRFLLQHVKPGMVIFDVGANCGQMTLFFMKHSHPGGRIVSFEPVQANASYLRKNIELQPHNQARLIQSAAAAVAGFLKFYYDPKTPTMGGLEGMLAHTLSRTDERIMEVECVSLDDVIREGEEIPELIKIDCEGGGLGVIQGAEITLTDHRPKVFFEIHASSVDSPEMEALRLLSQKHGYNIYRQSGAALANDLPHWGESVWCVHPRQLAQ